MQHLLHVNACEVLPVLDHVTDVLLRLQKWQDKKNIWPEASTPKIFGSVAKSCPNPGDVDFFLSVTTNEWSGHPGGAQFGKLDQLLALARKHYGYFDPFVLVNATNSKTLWVRCDEAKMWVPAKRAQSIIFSVQEHGVGIDEALRLRLNSKIEIARERG